MTPTACDDFRDRLARAAEVSPDDQIDPALIAHLQTCAACRASLDDQRHVRAMLAARPPLTASPALRVRVRDAVEREGSLIGGIDFRRWTWRLVPIAAALAAVTAFGVAQMATDSAADGSELADLPVSAALYASDVSDTLVLSLMLRAQADDRLGNHVEQIPR